ncbi:MAG: class I SAM-dependent methyltransferase [Flammeovirgaceae bacterium]|nr:class I SAM-dependent methyltransferase [Flammeovirgaceae bacterium]
MTAKDHYANHLSTFYSWMVGDFKSGVQKQKEFFKSQGIIPKRSGTAIDLGAGNGIQTVALAELDFHVHAIDFDENLVQELKKNSYGMSVSVIRDDIRNLGPYIKLQAELIVCCGDTLTHLENLDEVTSFLDGCVKALDPEGVFVLTFRDYSIPLEGAHRFIPVKSDEQRILTCVLDYEKEYVNVTDLLYEKAETGWNQKVSSYKKIRINPSVIVQQLSNIGMTIKVNEVLNRLHTIIASKST